MPRAAPEFNWMSAQNFRLKNFLTDFAISIILELWNRARGPISMKN